MVERPIKRAELEARRAAEAANPSPESASTDAKGSGAPRRSDKRDSRDRDGKGRGKGGKRGFGDDEPRAAVNPALVRGPKPQKAKPPEPEPEIVEEPIEAAASVDAEAAPEATPDAPDAPSVAEAIPEAVTAPETAPEAPAS